MIKNLKYWYANEYQTISWHIGIARGEYEKIGSFVSPTLLVISVLKLFHVNIKLWQIPLFLFVVTVSAFWGGKFLVKMKVPQKNAELGNSVNPQFLRIIELLERSENANNPKKIV